MKCRNIIYICSALYLGAAVTACQNDYDISRGEGRLMLSTTVNTDITVVSRADDGVEMPTNEDLVANTVIWISGSKGLLHKYNGPAEFPAKGLFLTTGSYVAEGWTGDSVPASFTSRYFTGRQDFEISSGVTTPVSLTCRIANTGVSVTFDPKVGDILKDYTMVVALNDGIDTHCLTYDASETRRGYFMRNSRTTALNWTLHGTRMDGTEYTRTGIIDNPRQGVEYRLQVKCTSSDTQLGGGYFTIDVDESTMDVNDVVIIALAPEIIVVNPIDPSQHYNLNEPIYVEKGNIGALEVFVEAAANLVDVVLDSDVFDFYGLYPDYNFIGMSDEYRSKLEEIGVTSVSTVDTEKETSYLRIIFSEDFMNGLAEGEYNFDVTATDDKETNRTSSASFRLVVSSASVKVSAVDPGKVYTDHATLSGSVLKDGAEEYGFLYRPVSSARADADWNRIAATVTNRLMTAEVTGLTPGLTYEYTVYAVTSGVEEIGNDIQRFTTEDTLQLPNAGFEDWNTSATPYLVYGNGGEMFWDSGNHGSATLSKNITTPDSELKHAGNFSAKLASENIVVKFAAGNVFIGEYLETAGTDGVLGWGRPFTSRPKALRGYVKYNPGTVNYGSGAPGVNKGDLDKGIIYIALMDDHTESHNGKNYPVIIKTKSSERRLFDPDSDLDRPHVIAYGEQVFDSATDGESLIPFEIELDYRQTGVKVSNIIVVASASKGGDYYMGGQSTMWIDDLELVY